MIPVFLGWYHIDKETNNNLVCWLWWMWNKANVAKTKANNNNTKSNRFRFENFEIQMPLIRIVFIFFWWSVLGEWGWICCSCSMLKWHTGYKCTVIHLNKFFEFVPFYYFPLLLTDVDYSVQCTQCIASMSTEHSTHIYRWVIEIRLIWNSSP